MKQLFVDSALQDRFLPAGYVQVPMLSAKEVSYLISEMVKLRPDDNFNPPHGEKYWTSYHCSFLDKNVDYKRQAFDLIKFDQNHPEHFEKIEVDEEFFLSQSITDMIVRQPHWKSLGFVENKNRYISEEEFIELLKKGDEIRQKIYFPNTNPNS